MSFCVDGCMRDNKTHTCACGKRACLAAYPRLLLCKQSIRLAGVNSWASVGGRDDVGNGDNDQTNETHSAKRTQFPSDGYTP